MNELVLNKLMRERNFKTQQHTLMKSLRIGKELATSILVEYFENRVKKMSDEELLKRLDEHDNALLYKITYARKDAERAYFKAKKREEQKKLKLIPLTESEYIIDGEKVDTDLVHFVTEHIQELFPNQHPKTRDIITTLINHGSEETLATFDLTKEQLRKTIWNIIAVYIPKNRARIDNVLNVVDDGGLQRQRVIEALSKAHYADETESEIQRVIDQNKEICSEIIGECDTPYIHEQRKIIDDYTNASNADKMALARYIIKLEREV